MGKGGRSHLGRPFGSRCLSLEDTSLSRPGPPGSSGGRNPLKGHSESRRWVFSALSLDLGPVVVGGRVLLLPLVFGPQDPDSHVFYPSSTSRGVGTPGRPPLFSLSPGLGGRDVDGGVISVTSTTPSSHVPDLLLTSPLPDGPLGVYSPRLQEDWKFRPESRFFLPSDLAFVGGPEYGRRVIDGTGVSVVYGPTRV